MTLLFNCVLFLIGISIGSFLNVLIMRYNPDKDIFFSFKRTYGRSYCPYCKMKLKWYELIPLFSYIIQRGKCRNCKHKLSLQYPLVELFVGLVFIFVPVVIKNTFVFLPYPYFSLKLFVSTLWIIVFILLISSYLIDIKYYIIPDSINLALFIIGSIWTIFGAVTDFFYMNFSGSFLKNYLEILPHFSNYWMNHLLGMFVGFIFFFLILVLSKGKAMGMGDVKLISCLGLLFGWPDIIVIIMLSFLIGALWSIFPLISGRKKLSDKLPFGPFIVISSFIIFIFGAGLLSLYFGIIGI